MDKIRTIAQAMADERFGQVASGVFVKPRIRYAGVDARTGEHLFGVVGVPRVFVRVAVGGGVR